MKTDRNRSWLHCVIVGTALSATPALLAQTNVFPADGNVGIGTTSPSAKLVVQGTSAEAWIQTDATRALALGNWDGTWQYIKSINLGSTLTPLQFQASVFSFTSGNVGIGTTAPEQLLDVNTGSFGAIKVGYLTTIGSTAQAANANGMIGWNVVPSAGTNDMFVMRNGYSPQAIYLSASGIAFHTSGSGGTAGAVFSSPRLQIDPAGNVGIGTTTPQAKLDVAGSVNVQGAFTTWSGGTSYYGIGQIAAPTLGAADLDISRPNLGGNSILRINYHTGISLSAHSYYGGIRFYNQGYSNANPNPYDSTIGASLVMAVNNGGVGIGTATPGAALEVYRPGDDNTITENIHLGSAHGINRSTSITFGRSSVANEVGGNYNARIVGTANAPSDYGSTLQLQTHSASSGVWNTGMFIDHSGNVGIGTTSPHNIFEVNPSGGGSFGVDDRGNAFSESGLGFSNLNTYGGTRYYGLTNILLGDSTTFQGPTAAALLIKNVGNRGTKGNSDGSDLIRADFSDAPGFILDKNGNVGIGATTPIKRLHVQTGSSGVANYGVDGIAIETSGHSSLQFLGSVTAQQGLTFSDPRTVERGFLYYQHAGDYMQFATAGAERVRIDGAGNVGIGTTSPGAKLDVAGTANISGNVTIAGTLSAASFLPSNIVSMNAGGSTRIVAATGNQTSWSAVSTTNDPSFGGAYADFITLGSSWAGSYFGQSAANWSALYAAGTPSNGLMMGTFTAKPVVFGTSNAERMRIDPTGNVGIGTTNPGTYKLAVNGTIHAKEVVVDQTGWADDVFDPSYRNAPLSEVEEHIKEHGHLPGVPSAQEVAEKGVSVGQMQTVLLQKIEELTLHMIEQEKQLRAQGAELKQLQQQNAALRASLAQK